MFSLKIVISFALIAFVAAYRKGFYFNSRFDSNYRSQPHAVKVTHGAIQDYGFTHERSDTGHGGYAETIDYGVQDQGLELGGGDDGHDGFEEIEELKELEGFGDHHDHHDVPSHDEEESLGYSVHDDSQVYADHEASAGGHEDVKEECYGYGGDDSGSDGYGHEDSHDVDYFAHPAYKYEYGVKDHKTGDHKSHWEHRDGDKVTGEYTVDEADGTKRIVSYTSDKKNGFQAIVKKIGTPHFPEHKSHKDGHH